MKHELLRYVEGDLFEPLLALGTHQTVLVPHVCNNRGKWGKGFVVPLGRTFPAAQDAYLNWHAGKPPPEATYFGGRTFQLGATQALEVKTAPRIIVLNMIAQEMGGPRPLRYNALATCMDHVAEAYRGMPTGPEIRCPMFGSALAGGTGISSSRWCWIVGCTEGLGRPCTICRARCPTTGPCRMDDEPTHKIRQG